jgi:hypothetical protein
MNQGATRRSPPGEARPSQEPRRTAATLRAFARGQLSALGPCGCGSTSAPAAHRAERAPTAAAGQSGTRFWAGPARRGVGGGHRRPHRILPRSSRASCQLPPAPPAPRPPGVTPSPWGTRSEGLPRQVRLLGDPPRRVSELHAAPTRSIPARTHAPLTDLHLRAGWDDDHPRASRGGDTPALAQLLRETRPSIRPAAAPDQPPR